MLAPILISMNHMAPAFTMRCGCAIETIAFFFTFEWERAQHTTYGFDKSYRNNCCLHFWIIVYMLPVGCLAVWNCVAYSNLTISSHMEYGRHVSIFCRFMKSVRVESSNSLDATIRLICSVVVLFEFNKIQFGMQIGRECLSSIYLVTEW